MIRTLCALAIACFMTLAGCGPAEPSVDEVTAELNQNGCHYKCAKCHAGDICAQYCVAQGHCNACIQTMFCIQGYVFDNKKCQCVADPTSVPCGPTFCTNGDVCCNASCGVCTPPGG